jgi:hypothetical protein
MKDKIIIAVILGTLSGCSILPDSIPVEAQHLSHVTQHFGSHPTNYGTNVLFIGAKWEHGPVTFEVKDGYSTNLYDHRHEMFESSIKYEFRIRK